MDARPMLRRVDRCILFNFNLKCCFFFVWRLAKTTFCYFLFVIAVKCCSVLCFMLVAEWCSMLMSFTVLHQHKHKQESKSVTMPRSCLAEEVPDSCNKNDMEAVICVRKQGHRIAISAP